MQIYNKNQNDQYITLQQKIYSMYRLHLNYNFKKNIDLIKKDKNNISIALRNRSSDIFDLPFT